MKRIIIIHRWEGGSHDDWRPWIVSQLKKQEYEVIVPDMPDTDEPVIEKWVQKISEVVGTPNADTYFIGHSIGCQAILRYIETIDSQVGGALFVAGWFNLENIEDEESEAIARPWIETPHDFEKLQKLLPQSTLLISDNDPYGALKENIESFGKFVTNVHIVEQAGHFLNSEEPVILEELNKIIQQK